MENIYELGKRAKAGDDVALLEIVERKKPLLEKMSFGDADRYHFILEKVITRN